MHHSLYEQWSMTSTQICSRSKPKLTCQRYQFHSFPLKILKIPILKILKIHYNRATSKPNVCWHKPCKKSTRIPRHLCQGRDAKSSKCAVCSFYRKELEARPRPWPPLPLFRSLDSLRATLETGVTRLLYTVRKSERFRGPQALLPTE